MSSSIELEFSAQDENQLDTLTIICLMASINDDDRTNIEAKLNCLTERICFVRSKDKLKTLISSTKGFALLLVDCKDYVPVTLERDYLHEAIPIYSRCSHLPSACPEANFGLSNKVTRSERRISKANISFRFRSDRRDKTRLGRLA